MTRIPRALIPSLTFAIAWTWAGAAPMDLDTALKTLKTSKQPKERLAAVHVVGKQNDPKLIPVLIEALRPATGNAEDDFFVGGAAVKGLVALGTPAVEPLKKALADGDARVRRRAIDALARIRPPDVVDIQVRYLKSDPDAMVRTACIFNLRDLKDPKTIPILREVAKSDKDQHVKTQAAKIADMIETGGRKGAR